MQLAARSLTADEFDDAERYIAVYERSFIEAGAALLAIHERGEAELTRRGYSSFEDYCEQRWHWRRSHAFQVMQSASAVKVLSATAEGTNGYHAITERQARELSRAHDDDIPRIWERAESLAGERNVTAAVVRQARQQVVLEDCGDPPGGAVPYVGPFLNFWSANDCDPRFGRAGYDGRLPGQFVQALLWLYSVEGDLVLDPFAGSGTTIDVCRQLERRCAAFDLAPCRDEIVQRDALELLPRDLESPATFVLLDPPYWSQKRGDYTDDSRDPSNLKTALEFYGFMEHLARILKPLLDGEGAHVALALSQSRVANQVYDLAFECAKRFEYAGYRLVERIVTNYGQASSLDGSVIARSREQRFLLRGFRDITVFSL